jgi:hypothetical protein
MITTNDTLKKIQNEKTRELLLIHRQLVNKYLKFKNLKHQSRVKLLKYYDTQINQNNIEHHYNQKIPYFLNILLT